MEGINVDSNNCNRMIQELCREFEGRKLEDIYPIQKFENEMGEGIYIERENNYRLERVEPNKVKQHFKCDLKLVKYIRENTENYLKELGITNIDELIEHGGYSYYAREIVQYIENGDYCSMEKVIRERRKKSDYRNILLSNWIELEDLIFIDIETFGLYDSPIILIGIGNYDNDILKIRQYLVRDPFEECIVLNDFIKKLDSKKAIISFNGRSFDVPVLNRRITYYGFDISIENVHFDLLHYSKDVFPWLSSHSLDNIENEILGVKRHIDIESELIPEYYAYYKDNNNIGPLIPIIEHNYIDVLSLVELYSLLNSVAVKELD
ncbi:MAG: ribonuclease H-like domain-containing protein [Candidatus Helarchaeota archaeon]